MSLASLLARRAEPADGGLDALARQLCARIANLRADAVRLEQQIAASEDADTNQVAAARLVEHAGVLADLIGTVVDVQRIRRGHLRLEPRPINLVRVAATCIDEVRTHQPQLRIRYAARPAAIPVMAEPKRLAQVLECVLDDAGGRSQGAIDVRVGTCRGPNGHGWAVVAVRQQDRADVATDGALDVELVVAREMVRLHGGQLWVGAADRLFDTCFVLPLAFPARVDVVQARGRPCPRRRPQGARER